MKAVLEFNLPEDQKNLDVALDATKWFEFINKFFCESLLDRQNGAKGPIDEKEYVLVHQLIHEYYKAKKEAGLYR